tara:strand:- start:228 stop:407 length:180 start_codon:yes stop_codon:yes gene_type:complete
MSKNRIISLINKTERQQIIQKIDTLILKKHIKQKLDKLQKKLKFPYEFIYDFVKDIQQD